MASVGGSPRTGGRGHRRPVTGVLKAQRLFRPGKDPNGGDENGDDDFACEERRAFALSIALNREPFNC